MTGPGRCPHCDLLWADPEELRVLQDTMAARFAALDYQVERLARGPLRWWMRRRVRWLNEYRQAKLREALQRSAGRGPWSR